MFVFEKVNLRSCRCCWIICRYCRGVVTRYRPGFSWFSVHCIPWKRSDGSVMGGGSGTHTLPLELTQWCILGAHVSTLVYRCVFHRTVRVLLTLAFWKPHFIPNVCIIESWCYHSNYVDFKFQCLWELICSVFTISCQYHVSLKWYIQSL